MRIGIHSVSPNDQLVAGIRSGPYALQLTAEGFLINCPDNAHHDRLNNTAVAEPLKKTVPAQHTISIDITIIEPQSTVHNSWQYRGYQRNCRHINVRQWCSIGWVGWRPKTPQFGLRNLACCIIDGWQPGHRKMAVSAFFYSAIESRIAPGAHSVSV